MSAPAGLDIAVVGSGISGLAAAYLLQQRHKVTLYEGENRIGGHSRTVEVDTGAGKLAVDTGFIVFNERNYPQLCALFEHLGVSSQPAPMSFGVSVDGGRLQYSSRAPFAQKRNLLRPHYWRLLVDILRFNRSGSAYLLESKEDDLDLQQYLERSGLGAWFADYYLKPMAAAIWSCPLERIEQYPARSLLQFFANHGLLTVNQHPQWRSVVGGSRQYLQALSSRLDNNPCVNTEITGVSVQADGVLLHSAEQASARHQAVVLACHADQAAQLLGTNPAAATLGAFSYQSNKIFLHSDTGLMPPNRKAWASWNYLSEAGAEDNCCVSYWMNDLQQLPGEQPLIVSLNPKRAPSPELTWDQHQFRHPVFNQASLRAQRQLQSIQGLNNIWYCGAWQSNGFHEDGLLSAIRVARALGCPPPW